MILCCASIYSGDWVEINRRASRIITRYLRMAHKRQTQDTFFNSLLFELILKHVTHQHDKDTSTVVFLLTYFWYKLDLPLIFIYILQLVLCAALTQVFVLKAQVLVHQKRVCPLDNILMYCTQTMSHRTVLVLDIRPSGPSWLQTSYTSHLWPDWTDRGKPSEKQEIECGKHCSPVLTADIPPIFKHTAETLWDALKHLPKWQAEQWLYFVPHQLRRCLVRRQSGLKALRHQ